MREIKFRAWVKSYESMIELLPTFGKYDFEDGFVASFVVDGYSEFGAHEKYDVQKNDLILMQYTGLKDKNGKEIWECDVVRNEAWNPELFVVKFERGEFYLDSEEVKPYQTSIHYVESFEVIGNIYENPELSKEEQK